jgi:hypothetical protein
VRPASQPRSRFLAGRGRDEPAPHSLVDRPRCTVGADEGSGGQVAETMTALSAETESSVAWKPSLPSARQSRSIALAKLVVRLRPASAANAMPNS